MKKHILVIHGPNLNLVGEREVGVYGSESFDSINKEIQAFAENLGLSCEIYQSNIEGEIIDKIQTERHHYDGIVANMGAYTHYITLHLDVAFRHMKLKKKRSFMQA